MEVPGLLYRIVWCIKNNSCGDSGLTALFATVKFFIPYQAIFLDKVLVAINTGRWTLARVQSFAVYQTTFQDKALLTDATYKWLVTTVWSPMSGKHPLLSKAFLADMAYLGLFCQRQRAMFNASSVLFFKKSSSDKHFRDNFLPQNAISRD